MSGDGSGLSGAVLNASWELDLFGRVRRNVQAQGAFVAVSREDLRDIQVSLTAELARAYFESVRGVLGVTIVPVSGAARTLVAAQIGRAHV